MWKRGFKKREKIKNLPFFQNISSDKMSLKGYTFICSDNLSLGRNWLEEEERCF